MRGPDAFKRFVDACHARGMGVVLDVVYNHLGPSGAYLDRFGPYFAGSNIWGPTINLDGAHSEPVEGEDGAQTLPPEAFAIIQVG